MQLLKWNLKGALPTAVLVVIPDEYAVKILETKPNYTKPGEVPEHLEGSFTVDNYGVVTAAVKDVDPTRLKVAADSKLADKQPKEAKVIKESAPILDPEAEALKRSKDRAAKIQKGK